MFWYYLNSTEPYIEYSSEADNYNSNIIFSTFNFLSIVVWEIFRHNKETMGFLAIGIGGIKTGVILAYFTFVSLPVS